MQTKRGTTCSHLICSYKYTNLNLWCTNFKNKRSKSLDKRVFLSEECLIINISPTCKNMPSCAYDKLSRLNHSTALGWERLPLNPTAEWTVRTTPPYLWLYLWRGERQSGLQEAINHGTFPATQASTLASHTGEMKGRV